MNRTETIMQITAALTGIIILIAVTTLAFHTKDILSEIEDEKAQKLVIKDIRFHIIAYGCFGIILILKAVYAFTQWSVAERLVSAFEPVMLIYVIVHIFFRPYKKGWTPYD